MGDRLPPRGIGRLEAVACLLAAAFAPSVHGQYSASIDIASRNWYRGSPFGGGGPVVRAGLTADATSSLLDGAYADVSAAWRTADRSLADAQALAGWSRRLDTLPGLSSLGPDWGWDAGVHVLHYGGHSRYDFHEFMAGLLAPGWSVRAWWTPHYFGGPYSSWYGEINGGIDLSERWRLFAHAGVLRYGNEGREARAPNRADVLVGLDFHVGRWNARIMRSGRTSIDSGDRATAATWLFSTGMAF